MEYQFRLIFVIFCFVLVLLFAVYLRSANNHIFYKLCTYNAEQSRLKQELGRKQLQLESLINPAAVSANLQ
jgi:Tfp pilus assembly protein PilO